MGHRQALQRPEADSLEDGGLVRMARCNLPGDSNVQEKVEKRLRRFGNQSWVFARKESPALEDTTGLSPTDPPPVTTDWVYECTKYSVTEACTKDQDTGELYDCHITHVDCEKEEWVYYEDDEEGIAGPGGGDGGGSGGSGSGDGGGDDGDPCSPDEFGGIPDYCEVDTVIICEGDPVENPEIAPTPLQGIDGGRYGAPRSDGTPHDGLDIKSPLDGPLHSMFDGMYIQLKQVLKLLANI